MYCIHCGAFLDDDAHFCTQCGKAVEGFEPQPASGKTENATIKQGIEKVQQILAALHDNDIKASDTKGEIRCPLSDVQNGFIHLIKRGLLVWVLMLMLPLTGWAQDIHEQWGEDNVSGTCDITFSGEKPSFVREDKVDKQTGYRSIIFKAYNVHFRTGYRVYLKIHAVKSDWDQLKPNKRGWWGFAGLTIDDGIDGINEHHKPSGLNNRFDLETDLLVLKNNKKVLVSCGAGKKSIYVYLYGAEGEEDAATPQNASPQTPVVTPEPEEPIVEEEEQGPNDYVIDTDADDIPDASKSQGDIKSSSEDGDDDWWKKWGIPVSVISVLTGAGARKLKNKKKKKNQEDEKDKEDDDEEESYRYELCITKRFSGQLVVGENPQAMYAYMARIDRYGSEKTDEALTRMIQIEGDGYLQVSGHYYQDGTMCAFVEAPEITEGEVPAEGIVKFRLAAAEGSFTNRVHFDIVQPAILFAQENLTLPAGFDEVAKLPFFIQNISEDQLAKCEAEIDGAFYEVECQPSDMHPQVWYACIKEKEAKRKEVWEAGKSIFYILKVTAHSVNGAKVTGELFIYRLQMGLHFECEGHIGCYFEKYDNLKHPEPLSVETESGKRYAPHMNRALFTLITWNKETNKVVYARPDIPEKNKQTIRFRVEALPPEEDAKFEDVQSRETRDLSDDEFIQKLNIQAYPCHIYSDNSIELSIFSEGMLDAPSRRKVRLVVEVDCLGETYTSFQDVWLCSQPLRNVNSDRLRELIADDNEKLLDLQYMRQSIIHMGGADKIFPLIKIIDLMIDGYHPNFGFAQDQYDMVVSIYQAFCRNQVIGANAEAEKVEELGFVCDVMRAFADTSTQLDGIFGTSKIGILSRIGLGFITFGWSEVGMSVCRISKNMIEVVEREQNPGGPWEAFMVGVKDVTTDYVTERVWGELFKQSGIALKNARPEAMARITKSFSSVGGKVKNALGPLGRDVKDIYKDLRNYTSNTFGKQAKQTVTSAQASLKQIDIETEKAILEIRSKEKGTYAWTEAELQMQADYATHSQEALKKVRELEHAYHEYRAYRTPETEAVFKELCLQAQGDKLVQKALLNNNSPYAHNVISEFNKTHKNIYTKVDKKTKQLIAAELNVDPDDVYVFNATSGDVAAYENGFALPRDRDVTWKIKGNPDIDVPQKVSEKCYNEAYRKETGGFDPTMNDQAVVQKGSAEMIGAGEEDLARALQKERRIERFESIDGVATAFEHKPQEWVNRSHEAAAAHSYKAASFAEEGMRQAGKVQNIEMGIAIANNSFNLLTKEEKGVMSLINHLDVFNPKTHVRVDISEFTHNLRIRYNMSVDDIGPMLKKIVYRLEAAKPVAGATKSASKAAKVTTQTAKNTGKSASFTKDMLNAARGRNSQQN